MNLKKIVLLGTLFFSTLAFSQNKTSFDVYKTGGLFGDVNIGSLEKNCNNANFSFLKGRYKMSFNKETDSTYQEIVRIHTAFYKRTEIFDYLFKDSCYVLKDYSADKPRKVKEALKKRVFNKKYGSLLDLFNDFEKGNLKDSIHFFVLGDTYSIKINMTKKGKNLVFDCNLEKHVKEEPGDDVLFDGKVEVYAKELNGGVFPFFFSTEYKPAFFGFRIPIPIEGRRGKN